METEHWLSPWLSLSGTGKQSSQLLPQQLLMDRASVLSDEKDIYKSPDPDKLLNPSLVLRSINTRNMSSRPGMRGGHSLNVIPESSILANQDPDFSLVDATGVDEAAPRKAAYEYEERAAGMQMGAKKRPSFDEMVARKSIEFRLEFSNKN